jgi:tetratricopeptide (TPR) repeat protein
MPGFGSVSTRDYNRNTDGGHVAAFKAAAGLTEWDMVKSPSKDSSRGTKMINHRALAAFERGQEWEGRHNPSKAIKAYHQAVAIEPDWADPHRRLGSLFFDSGRYDEAADAFRRLEQLLPAGDRSIDDWLHVIKQLQMGALERAAHDDYVAARDLPEEQFDEKIALCQKALGPNPTYAAPYDILGKALLAKGHPNQARAALERGLACGPRPFTRATLLFNLGNVLLATGQRDEALATFRQIVELNANPTATRFAAIQLDAAADGRI